MFTTPIIYMRDALSNIRTWQGEAQDGAWRSITGLINGNHVTSEWSAAPPKSQSTAQLQAEFECTAQYHKLLAKDYRTSLALVDVPRGSFIKPMLANKYPGWVGECFVQPKLDGMRCLANIEGLWSRGAKPIVSAPHINAALAHFFSLWPNVVLDGELYNPEYATNFNALMSILKKTRPSQDDLALSAKAIQYHIYDCFAIDQPTAVFNERKLDGYILQPPFYNNVLIQVPTYLATTEDSVDKLHMQFVSEGFEGSIVRLNRAYEQKRSSSLLKRKDFITEEFTLLRIEEGKGNWKGFAKRAVLQTAEGVEVGAGIRGDQTFCASLLQTDASAYQSVTIRHFGFTPDGSLRFPIATEFNRKGSLENRPALDSNSTENEM